MFFRRLASFIPERADLGGFADTDALLDPREAPSDPREAPWDPREAPQAPGGAPFVLACIILVPSWSAPGPIMDPSSTPAKHIFRNFQNLLKISLLQGFLENFFQIS